MSKLLLFVFVIATCHLLTCYGDSGPTCVVGQQNGTFVCSFCKSIPNVPLDIKQHLDMSRVPLKIANLIPNGLSWGTTIRLSDYIGADVSRFGLQNSYTFNVDIKGALNNLLTVNADVARGLTDSVVEKLLLSTQAFGDVCVDVKFSLCKQDVVLIGRFGAFKLFELPYSLFPSYKNCKSAFIPGKKIGYDVDTRSLTLCTDFVSLLYRNTMCIELKDIMWGGKGVHACPSISLGTTLANGNTFNADLPCFSIGDPDPCYTRTSCDSCVEDITCSWCSARKSCLSKAQALDPCSGCLAGFVETCDAAELQRENETCSDFYLFDTDNDWTVTRAEFNSELGYYLPADQAEETFAEYDLDQDGQITYKEFKQVRVAGLSAGAVAAIVIVTLLGVTAGAVVVTGVVLKKKKPETYNTVKGKLNSAWETTKTKSGTVRDKLKGAWGVAQAKATSLRSPS